MRRYSIPLLVVAIVACSDEPTAPPRRFAPTFAVAAGEDSSPPARRDFDDTYRVGLFTGQGITRPGLDCDGSTVSGRTCTGFLASSVDGTLLDVTVSVPSGPGPHPLVALIHGYAGSKSSSGDIAQKLTESGFAVLRYSTRGFGKSWGQVNMSDVHAEIADLRSMIAQVVDRGNLHLNADAVAVTGASYGGGHSWLALLQPTFTTPKGQTVRIRTVVPIAPWTDLLYSLVPNGKPRESVNLPGALKLTFVNGLYASGVREKDTDRPYPNYPDYFIAWHAWLNGSEPTAVDPVYHQISDGLAGGRSIWWQDEFWQQIASTRIPIFQVQGFTDDLFPLPEAKRMLFALKKIDPTYPIATYLGDLGHPRATNRPAEVNYVLELIRQWLGYYLKGEGSVPPAVIYANITRPRGSAFNPGDVLTVNTWDELSTSTDTLPFAGEALLINPATDPLGGFFWDPFVMVGAEELRPYTDVPPAWAEVSTSLATYDTPASDIGGGSSFLIAGQPSVQLHAHTFSWRVQLDVRLIDVAPDGSRELITRGTYTLDSGTPGLPIGDTDVSIQTYGNLWNTDPSHTIRLEISNIDSPYLTPSKVVLSETTISHVSLILPMR
jgi:pimeloyl-ACP methyl ester carboxylesterase